MISSVAKRALGSLGLAVIYFLPFIYPLIDPGHDFLYHLQGPTSPVYLSVLLDLLLGSLLVFAFLTLAKQFKRLSAPISLGLLASLPWMLYREAVAVAGWPFPHWISILSGSLILIVCIGFFLVPPSSSWLHPARGLAETIFAFCGLSALLILVQLAYFSVASRSIGQSPHLHQQALSTTAIPRPRVIWVLLDELSFDQVYEHRFPGLALPSFDALAGQSVLFTHTLPVGVSTEDVLPALMTGLPTDEILTSTTGNLSALRDPDTERWTPFDPTQTVFGDALRRGYSTSVVGWYNPYCRILAPVLDHCVWGYTNQRGFAMQPDASILYNALRPLFLAQDVLRYLLQGTPRFDAERRGHLRDFRTLEAATDRALADPSQTMLLLHMPVPHPPAFFDRHTGAFQTTGGSYLDSLALADLWLAHVKDQLDRQNAWDASTIILMGDHSWRNSLIWAHSPFWSREDQIASRDLYFDNRPAYLVKLPGQHTGARIDLPFNAIRTRALIDQLLIGSLHSPADLESWVAAGR